jgi:hypothetical protein
MALHNEIEFEKEVCEYLGSHGWLLPTRRQTTTTASWPSTRQT